MAVKKKSRKPVNVAMIPLVDEMGVRTEPYLILQEMLAQHHPHLAEANIGLAWQKGWNADKDGRLTLGQCRKASDLDRARTGQDAVILLNRYVWEDPEFGPAQKRALIDHELCHLALALDPEGEPKFDELGRVCYRMRKHTIEEFHEIVDRHGLYKSDLQSFAEAIRRKQERQASRPPMAASAS
jgi:hypothetical protein